MTLIASIQRPEGFFTVSDVMLSTERRGLKLNVDLPLRRQDLFRPFDESPSTEQIRRPWEWLKRRSYSSPMEWPFGQDPIIASAVLKRLAAACAQGQHPALEDVIQSSGISQRQADQISIIAFLDNGHAIVQQVLNTERLERRFASIVHAGTGSY